MPDCLPSGKAGGLQILCCQGIVVNYYNFNLDALALKPSGVCNVRVKAPPTEQEVSGSPWKGAKEVNATI